MKFTWHKIKIRIAWNLYLLLIQVPMLWYYSHQHGRWTYEKKSPCKIKLMFHCLVLPKHDTHSTLVDSYKFITTSSTFLKNFKIKEPFDYGILKEKNQNKIIASYRFL